MFHQAIVRVRAGTKTDRGGNAVPDWSESAVTRLRVGQVSVQPTTQAEENDASRSQVITGWQVISAPGVDADIRAADRVEWNGTTLEVVGEVGRFVDFGDASTHHIEFVLRRTTG